MRKLNVVRKLVAFALAAIMVVGSTLAVSAAELDTPVDEPMDPEPQVIGSVIGAGSGTIYTSGSIEAYLGSGNAWADIKVGSDESEDPGSISCSVTFPNGTSYNLGNILASGGSSSPREFSWCPAGTYTFYFVSSMNVEHSVWANIYD